MRIVISGFKTFNQVQSQGGPRDSNAGIYLIFRVLNPLVQHRDLSASGGLGLRGGFETTYREFNMLLTQYKMEFCRPPNPEAQHLRCVAHLDEDISDVLPYLNTVLNGHQYVKKPPSLTLKFNGKLITLYAKEIGINIVKDKDEAEKILKWLKKEINDVWKRRKDIKPSFEVAKKPGILDILKRLPKTNCQECGQPTCMVFAVLVSEGKKNPENCPQLDVQNKKTLQNHLKKFRI